MNDKKGTNILARPVIAVSLAVFACLLWGSAYPSVKTGYALFSVRSGNFHDIWVYAGIRFILAGVLVIAIMSLVRRRFLYPRTKDSWKRAFMLCLFQTCIQYGFYYIGLANTPGVKAALLNGLELFILLAMSVFIFRQEKLTAKKVIAAFIGLFGIVIMNLGGTYSSFRFIGDGFLIIAAVGGCFSSALIKEYSQRDDPVMLSGWQFIMGGIFLVLLGIFTGGSVSPVGFNSYIMMLYLAFISAVAYSLWSVLLKYNPVSRIAPCKFMVPVFGTALSALFLGEPITLLCLAALFFVAASIIISNR